MNICHIYYQYKLAPRNTPEDTGLIYTNNQKDGSYEIDAEDSDSFLSSYVLRLIINGGPMNGGEMVQSSGSFDPGLMSSSITDIIEIPMGSTEGHWNIRIILRDDLDAIKNIGPNDLENQNFQNVANETHCNLVFLSFFLY